MIFLLQIYYYTRFQVLSEDKEELHTSEIMKQVEERMVSFMTDVKDAAIAVSYNTTIQNYLESDDVIYKLTNHNNVTEITSGVMSSNKNISSIFLWDKKKIGIGSLTKKSFRVREDLEEGYEQDLYKRNAAFFGKVHNREGTTNPIYYYVHPILPQNVADYREESDHYDYSIVLYDLDYVDDMLSNIHATSNSLLMLIDNSGFIVSANKNRLKNQHLDDSTLERVADITDTKTLEFDQEMYTVQLKSINNFGLKIVSLIPVHEATNEIRNIRNVGSIVGLIMTLLIFTMGYAFFRSVTSPFDKIIRFMNNIGNKQGKQRMEIHSKNEIGFLMKEINVMLDKIDAANEHVIQTNSLLYETEITKKQAELLNLQSQINPHFLYNTLETIRSIALARNVMEVVEITTAISDIFRYSIKGKDYVTIENEMTCIQNYLQIMSIRYMDKFSFHIQVDDAIHQSRIPKMILQPIVENAIYHGLEQKSGKGILTIQGGKTEDNRIQFEITDNGIGIEDEKLKMIQASLSEVQPETLNLEVNSGLGLLNTHKRIQLAYGNGYGIEIDSKYNEGTTILVRMPWEDLS
ncbi:sensor histidine kinase [Gracilibacillus phocaeensis]|uniref:sensor histidine kinase n=1 Tax=Gracilibacillus phocaeensis TaxID=2042304 RepID=UPI001A91E23D|nr:sensor histidine kinase [Gracilibacillus phocaeensis]